MHRKACTFESRLAVISIMDCCNLQTAARILSGEACGIILPRAVHAQVQDTRQVASSKGTTMPTGGG